MKHKIRHTFPLLFLVAILIAIPITVGLLKERQDIRKRAQCLIDFPSQARNPATGECREFLSPCDIPVGWEQVSTCQSTKVGLSARFPGIGIDGNKQPQRMARPLHIILLNNQRQEIKRVTTTVAFDGAFFNGISDLGIDLRGGVYFIKVKFDNTLQKFIPETQTVFVGTTFSLPTVTLIPGDVNNDNALDILDYNLFVSCFGARVCNQKQASDFDDNGKVDGVDYNILLRGFKAKFVEPPEEFPNIPGFNFLIPTGTIPRINITPFELPEGL